jgi:hypothetical protein
MKVTKMKKSVIVLFLTISQSVFSHGFESFVELKHAATPEEMDTSHLKTIGSYSQDKLQASVHLRNFSLEKDKQKVQAGTDLLVLIINSDEFKLRVLNFTFKEKKQFNKNQGKTNLEIYNHLMTGSEVLMPESSGIMNFDLTLYKSKNPWSKVKGYTKKDTMRIWINKKFFRRSSWEPKDVAANMAHEWVHKMGYGHAFKYNSDRPSTVPYAIGYIIHDIASEMGY